MTEPQDTTRTEASGTPGFEEGQYAIDLEGRSSDEDLVVEALAAGLTHAEAGALINRSAKSVQRMLQQQRVADRVAAARERRLREATELMSGPVLVEAVETLRGELQAEKSSDRIRAAGMIIDASIKLRAQVANDAALAQMRAEVAELKALAQGTVRS